MSGRGQSSGTEVSASIKTSLYVYKERLYKNSTYGESTYAPNLGPDFRQTGAALPEFGATLPEIWGRASAQPSLIPNTDSHGELAAFREIWGRDSHGREDGSFDWPSERSSSGWGRKIWGCDSHMNSIKAISCAPSVFCSRKARRAPTGLRPASPCHRQPNLGPAFPRDPFTLMALADRAD